MSITRHTVADKIAAYLRHALTLDELVDWAENAMRDGDFDEQDVEALRTVVARLGVADVRACGLTWEDCEQALARLLGPGGHRERLIASPCTPGRAPPCGLARPRRPASSRSRSNDRTWWAGQVGNLPGPRAGKLQNLLHETG